VGVQALDAPVSGGDVGAKAATLAVMVGGPKEAFDRVLPILRAMGKTITHVGESGAGQVAKACNQIVAAVTVEAVGEALSFARRNGVDAGKVREALLGGFAYSKILEVHGQRMLDHDFRPGFKTRLHHKDLKIVVDAAHQLGLALPATALVAQHLNALMVSGDGELDSSALVKVIERMSGSP
jgi:2-hydroxy-3-oxopropionate reductase